jgi:hypothetical protein
MKFFGLLIGLVAARTALDSVLVPASVQAEKSRQASGSAKVDTFDDITPACASIGCADIQCLPPFELKRKEGQCCATCYAPDHVVAIDRHTALEGGSPYKADPAPAAPSNCKGVKCFTPACRAGETVGHVPGACCLSCK